MNRRPRGARTILGLALAVAVAGTPACGADREASSEPDAAAADAGAQRAGEAGVTVSLPSSWHSTAGVDGAVGEPVTRLVVSSSPIEPTPSSCQISAYEFADDAVALVVVEWQDLHVAAAERPARFTRTELSVAPPPAIECFDGAGGMAYFIEQGRTFGAYLLVGLDAPDAVVEEARHVLDTLRVEPPSARRLERNGVSLTVPPGWDGRLLFRDEAGSRGVIFQVANFELPENEGFEPPRQLPPGEEDPIKAMDDGDVLIMISDGAESGATASPPLTLADLTADHRRAPRGHSLARGSSCFATRCIGVEVDFGSAHPRNDLLRHVNEVLVSLAVDD